jgi:CHAT domain-containing protein
MGVRSRACHQIIEIGGKLNSLWRQRLKPIHSQKSETPSNLRWCPTGPFTFLPIHAAGIYNTEATESVSDYVISSYTPTLSALLPATQSIPLSFDFEMMAVIQPQTLPCTVQELQKIETHVPNECLVRLGIPGVPATVEKVVSHLSSASIAHFACHGQQEARSPLDSALILEDGELKVSRILQQSMPNALLAFLSACETAKGDKNLPDEAIHIGGALLSTGFRGVVATMW